MTERIAFFKDTFFCNTNNKTVTIRGIKRKIYNNGELVDSVIVDAECTGDSHCLYDLKSQSCPKKSNLNSK